MRRADVRKSMVWDSGEGDGGGVDSNAFSPDEVK